MTMDLNELADRVEALAGPDRETDAIIWLAVTPGATRKTTVIPENEQRKGWTIDETREASGKLIIVPDYTASIDAAMTLIDDGAGVHLERMFEKDGARWDAAIYIGAGPVHRFYANRARNAPLALTAAALRTKALGAVHTLTEGN